MNNPSTSMSGINRFYAKVYGFLGMGLALSAVTSYLALWVFPLQLATFINNFPLGFMGLWIVELILVMVLGVKAQKESELSDRWIYCLLSFEWRNISSYSCILRYWNSNASFLDSYLDVHGDVCRRSDNKTRS